MVDRKRRNCGQSIRNGGKILMNNWTKNHLSLNGDRVMTECTKYWKHLAKIPCIPMLAAMPAALTKGFSVNILRNLFIHIPSLFK